MKKHSRLLALLLVLVMVMTAFAACGNNGNDPDSTTTAPQSGDATTPSPDDTTVPDGTTAQPDDTTVPDTTYDGYEFTIMGTGDVFPETNEDGSYKNQNEEELADKLAELEQRLDITITKLDFAGDKLEAVTASAMGGTKLADLLWLHQQQYWPAAKANALLPLDDQTLVNAGLNYQDETRWYQPAMEWTRMFDEIWGLRVASKYVAVPTGYFVNFNKELCASAGYDDMYELVRKNEWNWDVYRDIARKVTKDTDSDGVNDIWGTGATAWGNEAISNGVQFVGEVDGKWQMTIGSEAGIRALQFLYDMNYGDGTRRDGSSGECREAFANGTVAFNWSNMGHINGPGQTIYESEHDYGIIPMPMGPDATEYYSMTDNNDAFVLMAANKDLDKVVPIMNEWALIVNDTESYLEILDDGRCRTEEDMEMMVDYIIPNYAVNLGKMTNDVWAQVDDDDNGGGLISEVSYNGMTPAAAVEAYAPKINAALDAFFEQ